MATLRNSWALGLGAAALSAALAWTILLVATPAGLTWLCGMATTLPWDPQHLLSLVAMWALMSVAMMLPCEAVRGSSLRGLAILVPVSLGGALGNWVLDSLVLDLAPLHALLLIGGAGLLILRARHLAMVCLCLAGGTDPAWMAVVTLWMLADVLRPHAGLLRLNLRSA